jgi:hypothetical protein
MQAGSGKMENLSYLRTEYAREKMIEEYNKPYKEQTAIPTKDQICLMCHLSAECPDCCAKCKKECSGQVCGLKDDPKDAVGRWVAWKTLVRDIPRYYYLYQEFITGQQSFNFGD